MIEPTWDLMQAVSLTMAAIFGLLGYVAGIGGRR